MNWFHFIKMAVQVSDALHDHANCAPRFMESKRVAINWHFLNRWTVTSELIFGSKLKDFCSVFHISHFGMLLPMEWKASQSLFLRINFRRFIFIFAFSAIIQHLTQHQSVTFSYIHTEPQLRRGEIEYQ